MNEYPKWLSWLIAFCYPAFMSLAGALTMTEEPKKQFVAFMLGGFGGLMGVGTNTVWKGKVDGKTA